MADKGSIHVETINSENHMILDCSNVDITGTLKLNGIDISNRLGNFDTSLDELLTIGKDASFTHVDISGIFKLNDIDISDRLGNFDTSLNNLLNLGKDASFTNLDISGSLKINNSDIKLDHLSDCTNDINRNILIPTPIDIDSYNSQLAARMALPLTRMKAYDDARQRQMRQALERIQAQVQSTDLGEVIEKALV